MSDCTNNSCDPCIDPTCLCDVQRCADYLKIGVAQANTQYFVHFKKTVNGAEYIHAAVSDGAGNIIIPLDQPNADWYNHFDGKYEVWVVQPVDGYYSCECNNVTITTPNGTFTRGSFSFVKQSGVQMSQVTLNVQC